LKVREIDRITPMGAFLQISTPLPSGQFVKLSTIPGR